MAVPQFACTVPENVTVISPKLMWSVFSTPATCMTAILLCKSILFRNSERTEVGQLFCVGLFLGPHRGPRNSRPQTAENQNSLGWRVQL